MMTGTDMVEILLVEDNPGDVELTREAFESGALRHRLHTVKDGEEAVAFLRRRAPFAEAPAVDLVILDLNLPRKDGREVLADVKGDSALCHLPIVVFTTSKAREDVLRSYKLHANCYLNKPVDLEEFFRAIRAIESFWTGFALLPTKYASA